MADSDDLRMRLEAHVAVRRAAGARAAAAVVKAPPPARRAHRRAARRRPRAAILDRALAGVAVIPGFIWRSVLILGLAVLCAYGLRTEVIQPFWIPSQSMEPTLHGCSGCDPDRLLVDKLSYRLHGVHRGDVVVFRRPPAAPVLDANLVKRVIGLSGDVLRASDGIVYVNNRALTEPYIAKACAGTRDFGPETVPAGDVFVMGDNRCDSFDSRAFGAVPKSLIVGRAFITVWPLPRIHWL